MESLRFDSFQPTSIRRVPSGVPGQDWLEVDGTVAEPGAVMAYPEGGRTVREYVEPDALDGDWLEQLKGAAVTVEHPPALLTPDTDGQYRAGTVKHTWRDGSGLAKATLRMTRQDGINAVRDGRVYLSPGYKAVLDNTPGVSPNGQRYDRRQVARRYGNHIAVTRSPRGGEVCRMDSEGVMPEEQSQCEQVPAWAKGLNDKMDAVMGRMDAYFAPKKDAEVEPEGSMMPPPMPADGAMALPPAPGVPPVEQDKEDGIGRMDSVQLARVFQAAQRLGFKDADIAGKTPAQVRNACLTRMDSALEPESKSEAYLQARFDATAPMILKGGGGLQAAIDRAATTGTTEPAAAAYGGMAGRLRSAASKKQ